MTNNDEIYWGQHTTQAQKRKQIPITRERKETKQSGKQRVILQEEREEDVSEVGMRRSGGTGTEAIMYLYIIACLSSSLHCALVKGNPNEAAITPAVTHNQDTT